MPKKYLSAKYLSALLFAVPLCLAGPAGALGQDEPVSFTEGQAESGKRVYTERCESCHGYSLGGEGGPPLKGAGFFATWGGANLLDLFDYIHATMPQDAPGSLTATQTANVLAYLLQQNGFAAGETAIPADADEVRGILPEAAP